ncbi:aspartyl-phosphate phosphatase Spo0E family protein [Anaerobacillus isosaccharinicus]|uniref:Aspartyl-phosphate phosphatase Spo0E family protein n=1 Tax=Anaerobacillus isosaccharinicus TaxID=1532552 RepID=A0A7S7LBL2_9BACI|nr:aspartyl-phosphate phosphatase Spo0E family protein [Anaerobacillus isosaccharinicus]MBA5584542.1 aspartyl-phosphate phosphatase Spo0E family protein [Anaerobacillus isosaccharinicus]MBA5588529.1 aspartyl-phosphate phosphatase Spo0E family protein [Anaerobacillus isosaccharinicus]QOY37075.1 aspartyl-phosphate phosphatase Spo0E family protein [Anaerobacillus isosaccharinicus]QOY38049.1 aspartyl-phosphate phosphatase Spo0E family protein [Anaerobacillus isosaccharinicus]
MPSNLTNQIEHKRKEMSEIIEKHGLSSTKAIRCSQDLDKLLNKYNESKLHSSKNMFLF